MEFLQPWLLWGITGVTVPLIIHFWYQKKGPELAWAAFRWLAEETSLKHRGIRLHEILLLLIRCLLIIVLALLLSKPVLDWFKQKSHTKTHLLQPDRNLAAQYRFELESALKANEKVFLMGETMREISEITDLATQKNSFAHLQKNLNTLGTGSAELHIYLLAGQSLLKQGRMYVPGDFQLHSLPDTVSKTQLSELTQLAKPVAILLDYVNKEEKQTLRAALEALGEVYKIPFRIYEEKQDKQHFDWVLTDHNLLQTDANTNYLVSGEAATVNPPANVAYLPDSLRFATSSLVQTGRLPEYLGTLLAEQMGILDTGGPISTAQLNAIFVSKKPEISKQSDALRRWLLVAFILLILLERGFALRKTGVKSYA